MSVATCFPETNLKYHTFQQLASSILTSLATPHSGSELFGSVYCKTSCSLEARDLNAMDLAVFHIVHPALSTESHRDWTVTSWRRKGIAAGQEATVDAYRHFERPSGTTVKV
jgi:hypothetical protein